MADLPSGGRPADSANGAIHRPDERAGKAPGVTADDHALAEVGDRAALARLTAAAQRDKLADLRDDLARCRDEAADARNVALAGLEAASRDDADTQSCTGAEAVIRAVGQRRRAAERRERAAEDRERPRWTARPQGTIAKTRHANASWRSATVSRSSPSFTPSSDCARGHRTASTAPRQ